MSLNQRVYEGIKFKLQQALCLMTFLHFEETSFHKLGTLPDSLGNLTAMKLIPGLGAFS